MIQDLERKLEDEKYENESLLTELKQIKLTTKKGKRLILKNHMLFYNI